MKRFSNFRTGLFITFGLILITFSVLLWALLGSAKSCSDKAALLWPGCLMQAHENLAGGLLAASGALFAAWWAGTIVRAQIDQDRQYRREDQLQQLQSRYRELSIFYIWLYKLSERFFRGVNPENDFSSAAVLQELFRAGELPEPRLPAEFSHLVSRFAALRFLNQTLRDGGIESDTRRQIGSDTHFIFQKLLEETTEIQNQLVAIEKQLCDLGSPPERKTITLVGERDETEVG